MFTKKNAAAAPTNELADGATNSPTPPPIAGSVPRPATKRALVIGMLGREDGVTLAELMDATGWQAHTVRAALTGLRKTGHVLEKSTRGGATCYQIVESFHDRR